MLNVAYIFPGQGAQYVGMGADLHRHYPQAKEVFERADRILGFDLTQLMFKGPLEELTKTINCQLAIFTASVASLWVLYALKPAIQVKYTAGLSLGEYTALVAADAISFDQALKLVRIRAQYMDEASRKHPGGMICLIGLSLDTVEGICIKTKTEVANLNCPGQIVISGNFTALEKAKGMAKAAGAKKVIPLKVGGAFHSSLMAPASQRLTQALEEVQIHPPKIPVISNVTAKEQSQPREIRDNLARQIVSRTHWEDSVRFIMLRGIKNFLEIGPGKVLAGLLRRIDSDLRVYNIETVEDLDKFREERIPCC